jgi:hypothetical protein
MIRNAHRGPWWGLGPDVVAACEDELALIAEHQGAGARRHTPRKRGARFSMKARWPSR